MRRLTLRQFRVFEAVARNLSFSRAAQELHLSQPAVSKHLSVLKHAGLVRDELSARAESPCRRAGTRRRARHGRDLAPQDPAWQRPNARDGLRSPSRLLMDKFTTVSIAGAGMRIGRLGEDDAVMLLSVTEGDDKPKKYPLMFRRADLVVVSFMFILCR